MNGLPGLTDRAAGAAFTNVTSASNGSKNTSLVIAKPGLDSARRAHCGLVRYSRDWRHLMPDGGEWNCSQMGALLVRSPL